MTRRWADEAMATGGDALKRLGGGRWPTRDGRFTIEPQSGSWVVLDGERPKDAVAADVFNAVTSRLSLP